MKTSKSNFLLHGSTRNHKGKKIKGKTILESFCHSLCFSGFRKLMMLSALTLIFGSGFNAFAQEKCETALTEAQSMYDAGRFAQAIVRLNLCVPDRIPPEQRIGAYRLLAICYLNEDYRKEARTAIRKIFDLNRQYEPDAVQDPQPYRDLAAEVKATLPKTLGQKLFGGIKKWLWICSGTAGAVAVVIFWPKKVEPDLPSPPPLP